MTLQASGTISLQDIIAEFGLSADSLFPDAFYGLGGAPSSGTLGFHDFYGRSSSPISAYPSVGTSLLATRPITLPSFAINDTCVVIIQFQGSASTVNTLSPGWTRLFTGQTSSGATQPTTMAVFVCNNTTVADRPLTLSNAGTLQHTQVAYVIKGGGVAVSTAGAASSSPTADPPQSGILTNGVSWIAIAAVTGAYSAATAGPTGFTFGSSTQQLASGYGVLTAFKEIANGGGNRDDPSAFSVTQTSTRNAIAYIAIDRNQAATAAATYNTAAGTVSANNTSDPTANAFKTFTANKAVTWTYTVTSGAATCNRVDGYSGTSIRFDLASNTAGGTSTVNLTATDNVGNVTNWTLTLTVSAYSPAPTFSLTPGTYNYTDTDNDGYTGISISASSAVTWTWTRTSGTASYNTVSPASGTSGTAYSQTTSESYGTPYYNSNSQTISLTATWSGGSASWTITTQANGVTYTGGGVGVGVGGVSFPEL